MADDDRIIEADVLVEQLQRQRDELLAQRGDLFQQNAALTAQVAALRAALGDVPAVICHGNHLNRAKCTGRICPWCEQHLPARSDDGHASDCQRQAALALTDVQAGERWAALERLAELVDAHADVYTHAEVRAALFALAALDGGRQGPDRSDPAE